jgi:hypothetical protein
MLGKRFCLDCCLLVFSLQEYRLLIEPYVDCLIVPGFSAYVASGVALETNSAVIEK